MRASRVACVRAALHDGLLARDRGGAAGLVDVRGDHRVHVSGDIDALRAPPDTRIYDLAQVHVRFMASSYGLKTA